MSQAADKHKKQPYSRKMAIYGLVGLMVFAMVAVLFLVAIDAAGEQDRIKEAEQLADLERQRTGTVEGADSILDEAERRAQYELEAAKQEAERQRKQREAELAALEESLGGGTGEAVLDEDLLAELDRAQQEAGQPPDLPSPDLFNGQASATGGGISSFEAYPGTSMTDQLAEVTEPEHFETVKPQKPPSARIVQQGTPIRAALVTRIDTRNEGPLRAIVTRDVYDSVSLSTVLIPRGSTLLGAYETDVKPGVDRVPAAFTRVVLPDGRAVTLSAMPGASRDGSVGIDGRYKSNILRAIGPSFVVAFLGQRLDRAYPAPETGLGGVGGAAQAPSVAQQVVPKINEAVMERYSAAKAYFIAEPGTEIRVIVNEDIEIPEAGA